MDMVSKILTTSLVLQLVLMFILVPFQSKYPRILNAADTVQGCNIIIGILVVVGLVLNVIWS